MSMPSFPEIDPEITCDRALNMILASIAMEELALSHIINAEGEKLQYVLGTLETNRGKKYDIDEVLKINQSVASLLDSVSHNQMLLKNKMDKAIHALSEVCPGRPCPPDPPCPPEPSCCACKCSASFKAAEKCKLWCAGSSLHWNAEQLQGRCIFVDPSNKTKIELRSKGRFVVSLAVNVISKGCKCNAAISLRIIKNHQRKDIFTVRSPVPCDGEAAMVSIGGIIIENPDYSSLLLGLESPDSLTVEDSMLSIVEI